MFASLLHSPCMHRRCVGRKLRNLWLCASTIALEIHNSRPMCWCVDVWLVLAVRRSFRGQKRFLERNASDSEVDVLFWELTISQNENAFASALASSECVALQPSNPSSQLQFKWLCDANSRIPGQLSQFD